MTDRSTVQANFTIERTYPYPPARVFRAFSDAGAKAAWFGEPADGMTTEHLEFDFRPGGLERLAVQVVNGPSISYDARYEDIVVNERIVTTYVMTMDGARMSVSVSTTEFLPTDGGTTLTLTEQGTFLDGLDTNEQREVGTREMFEALGKALANADSDA